MVILRRDGVQKMPRGDGERPGQIVRPEGFIADGERGGDYPRILEIPVDQRQFDGPDRKDPRNEVLFKKGILK